jgi:hypothetical protein
MKKTKAKKTQQPVEIAGLLGMEAAGIEPAASSAGLLELALIGPDPHKQAGAPRGLVGGGR